MNSTPLFTNRRPVRRFLAIILAGVLGLALAAIVAVVMPPTYEANATVYVTSVARAQRGSNQSPQALVETQDAQQKTLTLANLATSDVVAERVIQTLGLPMTASELGRVTEAQAIPQTVLIEVSARDRSADRAREIANTTAREFTALVDQLNEETPTAASDTTARLVDPALTPVTPSSPPTATLLALGLLAGLGVGFLITSLTQRTDYRIRDGRLLENVTNLPHLGSTPTLQIKKEGLGAVSENPAASERFKTIRTNLIQTLPDLTGRLLAVVSAEDDAGKTALTVGLAQAFQQAGYSVLVLDADLRDRSLTTRLGLGDQPGLVDQLASNVPLAGVIRGDVLEHIDVIGAGRATPYPSELLGSESFRSMIEKLRAQYHLVLIDTPGISSFTDGAVVARHTDGALLVVPHDQEDPQQVTVSIDAIAKAGGTVVGTVMTSAPNTDRA